VYFNVNFNVFFKLIIVHLLVSELYKNEPWCFNKGLDIPDYVSDYKRPN